MKPVLHILKKDIRGLRWEIVATVLLTLGMSLVQLVDGLELTHLLTFWAPAVAVIAWVLLVIQVVQRDGLVGTEHKWLTLPVRRWQMAAAKFAFVALFVGVPMVVGDLIVVAGTGFPPLAYAPGLAWKLVVLTGVILLPAAALGAILRTVPQALIAAFGLALLAGLSNGPGPVWVGVDWVPTGLGALLGAVAASIVLWVQYSRRWTIRARVLAVAGLVVSFGASMLLPWGAAFFCQQLFATDQVGAGQIRVTLPSDGYGPRAWSVSGSRMTVHFPLKIEGAPVGYRMRVLKVVANAGTIGETYKDESYRSDSSLSGSASYGLAVEMRRPEGGAVRLRGRVYLALLAPKSKQDFSFVNRRQMVPGVGVCEAHFDRMPLLQCWTPFKPPRETRVTFQGSDPKADRATAMLSTRSSLSPIPFEFSLTPMQGVGAKIERLEYSGDQVASHVLVGGLIRYETWAPVAYVVREFEVEQELRGYPKTP